MRHDAERDTPVRHEVPLHVVAEGVETAEQLRIPAYLIVNNRAEGNAPLTIASVARLLEERRIADSR